jgi:integrase
MDSWLPSISSSVKESTLRSYTLSIHRNALPALGGRLLQDLRVPDLNAFYAGLLNAPRASGGGTLSRTAVRYVHTILHKALADAVRWNLLAVNPADAASPLRPAAGDSAMRVWEPDDVRRFLAAVAGDRLSAARLLLASTGLQRGELLGLRWQDVDLPERRLHIRQALIALGGTSSVTTPKSGHGRTVALDRASAEGLDRHRRLQVAERLAAGPAWADTGFVFTQPDGRAVRPDGLTRRFAGLTRAAGLPTIRLHDVRHTHATLALRAGVHPKIVSERLGHATVPIALDTYSHVLPSLQEQAAETIAREILKLADDVTRRRHDRIAPEGDASGHDVDKVREAAYTRHPRGEKA